MQKLIFSLVLAAATLGIFGGLRQASFVWSDPQDVLAASTSEPAITAARQAWTLKSGEGYEPVTPTVWAIVKATQGVDSNGANDARTFHTLSLAVHVVSVVVVFLILSLVTQSPPASFVGAMLFAAHPLQVEPVAYVAAFKFVLGGALALIAIWQYLTFASAAKEPRRKSPRKHAYLGTLAFILAVLTTPIAVVTPLVAIVLEKLLPKRASLLSGRSPTWPLVLWSILAIVPAILAINAQNTGALATGVPFWARPFVAADAVSFYLSKIFVPVLIGPDYGRSPSYLIANWWGFVTWIFPVMMFALLSYGRSKARAWYAAAALLLVVALLPVLGLVLFEGQATSTVANRFAYLAMLAPALAVAYTVAMPKQSWLSAAAVLAVAASAFATNVNVRHWLTDDALWSHAVQVNPASPIAHATLGDGFRRQGDWQNAATHYRKALEVNAVSPEIHFYLGEIEREHGDVKTAVELYKKTLVLDPEYAPAYGRLGLAYFAEGDQEAALTHLRKAVELSPESEEPVRYLGMLYVKKGEYPEAITYLNKAERLSSGEPADVQAEIHALLGLAMVKTQQVDVAQVHLEKALKLDPSHVAAHRTLADIYFAQNKYPEARPHYEFALKTVTDDPAVYRNLGTILSANKQYGPASQLFSKALELKPDSAETLSSVGVSYFRLRQFTEAEASFKKALELNPSLADPHYFLGDIARWRGKEPEALSEYYRALKLDPTHLDANYRLGNHFMKQGSPGQAIRHFQAALKAAPEDQRLIYSIKQAERAQSGGDTTF